MGSRPRPGSPRGQGRASGCEKGPLKPCATGGTAACFRIAFGPFSAQSKSMLQIENATATTLGDEVYAICLAGG